MAQKKVFRIGIAMAGAVSAGAYTAGVIDFLLEALQKWEVKKQANRQIINSFKTLDQFKDQPEAAEVAAKADPNYDRTIPMHEVVLEVLGGASAGGMTAAITSLALFDGIVPVTDPEAYVEGSNLLYEAWVNLNDQPDKFTLLQMLNPDDLVVGTATDKSQVRKKNIKRVSSLLNAGPIRSIGAKAITPGKNNSPNRPAYVSESLEILLTLCSLRGIPVSIDFGSTDRMELAAYNEAIQEGSQEALERFVMLFPSGKFSEAARRNIVAYDRSNAPDDLADMRIGAAHSMRIHKWNAHFRVCKSDQTLPDYLLPLVVTDRESRKNLISAAIASGAFPFGLRPVNFGLEEEALPPYRRYIFGQMNRMFKGNPDLILPKIDDPFIFTAVDGGTVNNEPFGEVLKILEEREVSQQEQDTKTEAAQDDYFALLMIDPFPSPAPEDMVVDMTYQYPLNLEEMLPNLFGAVRGQSMVKEQEIAKGFSSDHTRGLIMPVRRITLENGKMEKSTYPIASGSLEGFGGFFHRSFRVHDFFLGRKNCQSFLRKHFSISPGVLENDQSHVFADYRACWKGENPEMYERFGYSYSQTDLTAASYATSRSNVHYPIIPDMDILNASSSDAKKNGSLEIPLAFANPKISMAELKLLVKPLYHRLEAIWALYINRMLNSLNPFVSGRRRSAEEVAMPSEEDQAVDNIMKKYFSYPKWATYSMALIAVLLGIIPALVVIPIYQIVKKLTLETITGKVFRIIVKDFKRRGLLE